MNKITTVYAMNIKTTSIVKMFDIDFKEEDEYKLPPLNSDWIYTISQSYKDETDEDILVKKPLVKKYQELLKEAKKE